HLTGLFLLSPHLNDANAEGLLAVARGMSRRELEKMLAIRFPRPDVPPTIHRVEPGPSLTLSCPGTGTATQHPRGAEPSGEARARLEPLSAERYRVEFTASAALRAKIEQARELVSHAVPNGDLALLFERALDQLIQRELKRRVG